MQTSLCPDLFIYLSSTREVVFLEHTVATGVSIVSDLKKGYKYEKLTDDVSMNQWRGPVFGTEMGVKDV